MRAVAPLVDEAKTAGRYHATFWASSLPSGVYIAQLQWNGAVLTRRMALLK